MNTLIIQIKTTLLSLFSVVALGGFLFAPIAQAVVPEPDGGYPDGNTAEGTDALFNLSTGVDNTATGDHALFSNTIGGANTANGFQALVNNTTGGANTANGSLALFFNTTGSNNTANGDGALRSNTTGSGNIAVGNFAGSNLTTGDNNIDIGNDGVADEANTIRIGTSFAQNPSIFQNKTFIAGINGAAVVGIAVKVNAAGQVGTAPSSVRFKEEIKSMDKASEAILALKPVTFRYKKEIDPERAPQFGLVAEDVQKVTPDLVDRDRKGRPYTVRYEAVNAMLLNEFLKEHREVQELKKQVAALTAGLQNVSAQLELNKPAPRTVANNQ